MDKRRAIQIMTKAAQLYREHLEDQKVLFLYGLPKEVKKQLQEKGKTLSSVQGYEVAFHRYNFLHLTGVRLNKKETASAIHLVLVNICVGMHISYDYEHRNISLCMLHQHTY